MLYTFIRKNILFKLDPELIHYITLESLNAVSRVGLSRIPAPSSGYDPVNIMGLSFPNRVGLAAGLDKNGDYIDALGALGFGFVEAGTVTPRPQPGNPKPRLFQIPEAEALVNRMGFNNKGVDHLVAQLRKTRFSGVIGVNIGKNKDTPLDQASEDYLICMRKVYDHADYITINLSSPNTPDLRKLQFSTKLGALMKSLKENQSLLAETCNKYVPLVVKLAPDLSEDEVASVSEILINNRIDGIIATNTTISRSRVRDMKHGHEEGGLSGTPLREQATHILRLLSKHLGNEIPLIASGGIMCAQDAKEKFEAGAALVQLYTGLVYRGPGLVREVAGVR